MRGRKPKPTRLKILNGNPGKRALNANEPAPAATMPSCPGHLDAEAKKEWRRVGKELHRLGLLTIVDRATLAAYCLAWSRWVRTEKLIQQTGGEVLKSKETGAFYQNPFLAVANRALEQVRSFGMLLGLDPSSRSRLNVEAPKGGETQGKARLFGGIG